MSKPAFKPITLEDLAPVIVEMRVELDYGRVLEIPIRMLTWHEWNEIGAEVLDPSPNDPEYMTDWNEGKKQKEFDPTNKAYLKAKEQAGEQRSYRRLLKALSEAGNDVARGDTVEEQIDTFIKTVSVDVARKLINKLGEMSYGGNARVIAQAESFRSE